MARNKLTEVIDELIEETKIAESSEPKGPFTAQVLNPRSDGNEHLREPEGETETVVRTPGTKKYGITDRRFVVIKDKKYQFHRHDPYGFWYIVSEKGRLPEALSGSYTSPLEAEKALVTYINSQ